MDDLQKFNQLKALLGNLPKKDQKFAGDLAAKGIKYKSLSSKQMFYVDKFLAIANGEVKAELDNGLLVGGFGGVVELFNKAKQHLKWPKIVLQCAGKSIYLNVAGPASANPGWINVMGEGQYPNREWFGRVNPTGSWHPSGSIKPDMQEQLHELLVEFGADPAGVAKKYGKLTGNCCFCNKALTDPKSTAAGFGPVCAKNFGLTEQWKSAVEQKSYLSSEDLKNLPADTKVVMLPFNDIEHKLWNYPVQSVASDMELATFDLSKIEEKVVAGMSVYEKVKLPEQKSLNDTQLLKVATTKEEVKMLMEGICWVCEEKQAVTTHEGHLICQDCYDVLVLNKKPEGMTEEEKQEMKLDQQDDADGELNMYDYDPTEGTASK